MIEKSKEFGTFKGILKKSTEKIMITKILKLEEKLRISL